MYIEPIKSKFRIIGYALIGFSFIYFALERIFTQFMSGLFYESAVANHMLPYCYFLFYLLLLTGSALINLKDNNKVSIAVVASTLLLGLPYPLQSLYNLGHPSNQPIYIFYDLFASAILMALTCSLIWERKAYKFIGILLLAEWFFFDYWMAMSGQYIFLGLSGMLTDMVAVLMVIYCILEIILEKTYFTSSPLNSFK